MESEKRNNAFWPSYVDIMTTLFAIMLILFAVSYSRFKAKEKQLETTVNNLKVTTNKYNQLSKIHSVLETLDPKYFEYNEQYVKNIFKISIKYQKGQFSLYSLELDRLGDKQSADKLRNDILKAGQIINETIDNLQKNYTDQTIKYLVVIEGQASADGFYQNDFFNNDVLSYQRALALHKFWCAKGLDFTKKAHCELVIAGSGEKGVPRDTINESNNQRFLIHIVPVVGNFNPGE